MATKQANPATSASTQVESLSLPLDGYTRWNDLKRIIPMSHEAVRLREIAGRFPKRVQLGSARCVGWPNREIHRWMADPANYRSGA